MKRIRTKAKELEDLLENKPGSGKNWNKRLTIPEEFSISDSKGKFKKTMSIDCNYTKYMTYEPSLTSKGNEEELDVKVKDILIF
jgi:hypothetical protein